MATNKKLAIKPVWVNAAWLANAVNMSTFTVYQAAQRGALPCETGPTGTKRFNINDPAVFEFIARRLRPSDEEVKKYLATLLKATDNTIKGRNR